MESSLTLTFTDESDSLYRNKKMKKSKINIVKQETKIILSTDSEYELKQDEDNKSWMEFIDNLIQKKITPTEENVHEEDVYLAD